MTLPDMLFDEYRPGDTAPCFYCTTMLTWEEMRPSAWGDPMCENVCADCRAEEEAAGGWMVRDPVTIMNRLERKHALITNITDEEKPSWGQRLRRRLARAGAI